MSYVKDTDIFDATHARFRHHHFILVSNAADVITTTAILKVRAYRENSLGILKSYKTEFPVVTTW
jgi:hypothetical protein